MAFDIGAVVAHIQADLTGFNEGIDEAKSRVTSLGEGLGNVGDAIHSFADKASIISAVVGGAFVLAGKSALDYASNLEQARVAYDAFTGSVEKGGEALTKVTEFARKTPFQLPEVVAAGQQLLGFGFSVDDLTEKLRQVGSLAIATHKPMGVAIDLFARAREGMFNLREFGQFGISREALEEFGVSFTKTGAAVNKSELLPALEKLINARFGNVLQKESETLGGTISNIKDDLGRLGSALMGVDPSTGTAIKGGIFEKIRDGVQMFYSWLDSHIGQIQAWATGAFSQLQAVFTQIWTALQPLGAWIMANQELVITFLKGLAIGIAAILIVAPLVAIAMNPFILVFAAIALAVAALYTAWQTNFLGFRDITQKVVGEITNFFNNYLKPVVDLMKKWWTEHWTFIAAMLKGAWEIIVGIITVAWDLFYGIIKIGIDLLTGNWKKAWDDIKQLLVNAWDGIKGILNGALDFIKGWGGWILSELVRPFQDAWNKISDLVNKIKGALDFTQRHSPSVVDIVQMGVEKVNDALGGLAFNQSFDLHPATSVAAAMAPLSGGAAMGGIYIDMKESIIADQASAMMVGEKIGDAIMKKLQLNIRF